MTHRAFQSTVFTNCFFLLIIIITIGTMVIETINIVHCQTIIIVIIRNRNSNSARRTKSYDRCFVSSSSSSSSSFASSLQSQTVSLSPLMLLSFVSLYVHLPADMCTPNGVVANLQPTNQPTLTTDAATNIPFPHTPRKSYPKMTMMMMAVGSCSQTMRGY